MLVDARTGIESEDIWEIKCVDAANLDWQSVDRVLRTITQRRAALDAEEARWLRQAEAMRIWRPLGMVSALDYMERALGYAPRAAQERLRVARALGSLPVLGAALRCGDLLFSAVRELTRVATPETELAWRDEAVGKNLREIEALVADHRPGDRPDDPKDPEVRTRVVRFELSAGTFALRGQARRVPDDALGSHLSDDEMIAAMCRGTLDGAAGEETDGRATFQVAVTVCERCRQGWQESAGASIAIGAGAVERVLCDAQHIGSIDGAAPERAYQDIPPSVARFVRRRDGGRCRMPGCRSSRGLELHHIVRRADGGSHDASNLVIACSACHKSHHDGILAISGTADRLEVRRPGAHRWAEPVATTAELIAEQPRAPHARAHVGATGGEAPIADQPRAPQVLAHVSAKGGEAPIADQPRAPQGRAHVGAKSGEAPISDDAEKALVGLGWKRGIATAAVTVAALAPDATLEQLIFEALKRCPQPRG